MQTNNKIEMVYELLEQFEFAELSETDKQSVLSVMTETEYIEMRKTIDLVKDVLQSDIEPSQGVPVSPRHTSLKRMKDVLNFNIKLYQVAASIAVLIASFFLIEQMGDKKENQLLATGGGIKEVHRTDTVHAMIYDTIVIIQEKVKYVQANLSKIEQKAQQDHPMQKIDCNQDLCPNEIGNIMGMNGRNTISTDSTIEGMLSSLN